MIVLVDALLNRGAFLKLYIIATLRIRIILIIAVFVERLRQRRTIWGFDPCAATYALQEKQALSIKINMNS